MKRVIYNDSGDILGIIKYEDGKFWYKGNILDYVKKTGLKNVFKNPFYSHSNTKGDPLQYTDRRSRFIA